MNTARRGNQAEVRTAELLTQDGWLVASRRHIGGAGDLLAVKPGERSRLIEVKKTPNLYQCFRRADRAALVAEAERFGVVAEVAWWKPRARQPEWVDEASWPS